MGEMDGRMDLSCAKLESVSSTCVHGVFFIDSSDGPDYINDNFPLIDKFLKCTVQRFPAGGGGEPQKGVGGPTKAQVVGAVPETEAEKAKMLRSIDTPLLGSDADGSSFATPDNVFVIGTIVVIGLLLLALLGRGRKNDAKTQ